MTLFVVIVLAGVVLRLWIKVRGHQKVINELVRFNVGQLKINLIQQQHLALIRQHVADTAIRKEGR